MELEPGPQTLAIRERPVVLAADDDATTRMLLRAALERAGFAVVEAEDGAQAIDRFVADKPDIILLDVQMPGMDGFAACERIRDLPGGELIPIVMATGMDDVASVTRAYEIGATAFVNKPINWTMLQHQLRYLLRARSTLEALRQREAQVRYLAYHDAVTGLPNRALLEEVLSRNIRLCGRTGRKLAVVYVDLDRFKRINDSLGHGVGDVALKVIAERLAHCLRGSDFVVSGQRPNPGQECERDDTVGRFGGNEFVMLLNEIADEADAARVAERILETLRASVTVDGNEFHLSGSAGIAVYPRDGEAGEVLLRNADAAMRAAKRNGGNGYQYYAAAMNVQAVQRLKMESALAVALERNELKVFFQPQVTADDGRIVAAEALLRWFPEGGDAVSPVQFIPIAEESGLILPIGDFVLEVACRQFKAWKDQGLGIGRISVNVSAKQFWQPYFVDHAMRLVEKAGLDYAEVELELTESMLIRDLDETLAILHRLRAAGFKLAIDDFGTGYSSLSYLVHLPVTTLKIDASFVRRMGTDANSAAIVDMIAGVGQRLGLEIIAEGVETAEQFALLRASGCTYLQGFMFGKPVSADSLEALLRANSRAQV